MGYTIVRLLRLVSVLICATVIMSFGIFAIGETKTASNQQQVQLSAGTASASTTPAGTAQTAPAHRSTLHRAIDEGSEFFTSPFAGIVPASSGEWLQRSFLLIIALAVYGFALGFFTRWLSVRVL